MDKKYAKLIMVSDQNNNKYYEMIYEGGTTFQINYGRVEKTKTTLSKSISQWNSIYNEKVKKGYKDVTDLVSVQVKEKSTKEAADYKDIADTKVNTFINLLRQYTNNLVSKTYSVKCDKVSKKQIEEAQKILDQLTKLDAKKQITEVNTKLLELYTIIPRFMSNVKNNILPNIDIDKTLVQEQDNLDAIASQVSILQDEEEVTEEVKEEQQTFLDTLGVKMSVVAPPAEIKYIMDQLGSRKVQAVYAVDKPHENGVFSKWLGAQKNKTVKHLIHGTRCTSVIPILKEGLKIRPVGNFQFSGKAYGDGNYFSEVTNKSLGYTGYDNDKMLLVYEVHTGNPFIYNGWYRGNSFTLNYKELKSRDFDTTYVNAGNGLLNSEIIAYKEEQARIKYIIHLKN